MTTPRTASHTPYLPLLSALYTAQGLPFGFFTLALPVLLREAGWSLKAISLLQFLALPWAIKFLWAPWVDHRGGRRAWLLALQGAGCALALLLAALDLGMGSAALFAMVFLFNLVAATQDIVTDGLAVRLLDTPQRGLANGIQVGAYRLGMILGGGLLLWLFARVGWQATFVAMAALLALTTWPVWRMKEPQAAPEASTLSASAPDEAHASHAGHAESAAALTSVPGARDLALGWWRRALQPGMLTCAALIFSYRFGDQMVSALITPFLHDQGLSKETIAMMKGAVGSATSLMGAALGGWLLLRTSRRTALLCSGVAQAVGFGLYVAVAGGWGGEALLWSATVLEGIVGTMASVSLFALMMDMSDPQHAGTDYTLLASFVVAVGALGGFCGGALADATGYCFTFATGMALAALGVAVLVGWLDRHPVHPRVAQAWR